MCATTGSSVGISTAGWIWWHWVWAIVEEDCDGVVCADATQEGCEVCGLLLAHPPLVWLCGVGARACVWARQCPCFVAEGEDDGGIGLLPFVGEMWTGFGAVFTGVVGGVSLEYCDSVCGKELKSFQVGGRLRLLRCLRRWRYPVRGRTLTPKMMKLVPFEVGEMS